MNEDNTADLIPQLQDIFSEFQRIQKNGRLRNPSASANLRYDKQRLSLIRDRLIALRHDNDMEPVSITRRLYIDQLVDVEILIQHIDETLMKQQQMRAIGLGGIVSGLTMTYLFLVLVNLYVLTFSGSEGIWANLFISMIMLALIPCVVGVAMICRDIMEED